MKKITKNNKKAQTEILGLAIIVVIVSIGLLFVVKFLITQPPQETRESYIRSELASNILGSIMDADTNCKGHSIPYLIKDCAEYDPGRISCGGSLSCEYIESHINFILSNFMDTLGGNKSYKFLAELDQEILFEISEGNCTVWESANQPLPIYGGQLDIKFYMCK